MKQFTIALVSIVIAVAAYASITVNDSALMRTAYNYDKSTYDKVEVIMQYDNITVVEYQQGGRTCTENWTIENEVMTAKSKKACVNH